MNKDQALQVIKTLLDQAIKAGVINNLSEAQMIIQAFVTIQNELNGTKQG